MMKVLKFDNLIILPAEPLEVNELKTRGFQMTYKGYPIYQVESKKLAKRLAYFPVLVSDPGILKVLGDYEIEEISAEDFYDRDVSTLPRDYVALCCKKCHKVMFLDYTSTDLTAAHNYIRNADFGECKAGGYHVEIGKLKDYTIILENH